LRDGLQVIVFASQKGGVGKTTLTANLGVAAEIAGDGPAVLIDTDPQGSLAAWWNARGGEGTTLKYLISLRSGRRGTRGGTFCFR
jgi:chromosome partitioning protein